MAWQIAPGNLSIFMDIRPDKAIQIAAPFYYRQMARLERITTVTSRDINSTSYSPAIAVNLFGKRRVRRLDYD